MGSLPGLMQADFVQERSVWRRAHSDTKLLHRNALELSIPGLWYSCGTAWLIAIFCKIAASQPCTLQAVETAFKNETVGLVTREEFMEKRATISNRLLEEKKRHRAEEEEAEMKVGRRRRRSGGNKV